GAEVEEVLGAVALVEQPEARHQRESGRDQLTPVEVDQTPPTLPVGVGRNGTPRRSAVQLVQRRFDLRLTTCKAVERLEHERDEHLASRVLRQPRNELHRDAGEAEGVDE